VLQIARRPGADQLTIALPALLAAGLCAIELSTRSLWLDEGATVAIASQHGSALWQAIAHDGGNMFAYYLLMHVVIVLFGDGAAVIRLPSVIAEAATAGLVAALALRLFADRRIALSAGALTAVSLPLVFWGQDARGYALMAALGAGSFLALTAILQTPPDGRPSRAAVAAYVLTTLAALYVGFDAILLVPAQLLLLVVFRDHARVVVGAVATVAVLSVPLLVMALSRGSGQLFWVPKLSGGVLGQAALTLASAGLTPNFHETGTSTVVAVITGVVLVAALAAGVRLLRRDDSAGRALLVPSCWLLVPAILGLVAALAGEPLELSRSAVLLIPALALLLGWGLCHPRLPRGAGVATIAALLALRALQLAPTYGTSPENWRAAAGYVLAATRSDPTCVAFYPEDGRMPFDYYVPHDSEAGLIPVLPATPWSQVKPYVERYQPLGAGIAARCPRLWLIASHQGQLSGPPASRRDYARYQRLVAELRGLYGTPTLRHFGYAAQVRVYRFHQG